MSAKTSASSAADRPTVFLSYSHKDRRWLGELRCMLAPLVRDRLIDLWWDGNIEPSQKWREEIDHALASARVGVLLVSPNFLASDFITRTELPYLIGAAEKKGVKLLWVLLSQCLYEHTPLEGIQAAHDVSRPIRTLRPAERHAVLKSVCGKIAVVAEPPTACPPLPSPSGEVPLNLGRLPIAPGDGPALSPGIRIEHEDGTFGAVHGINCHVKRYYLRIEQAAFGVRFVCRHPLHHVVQRLIENIDYKGEPKIHKPRAEWTDILFPDVQAARGALLMVELSSREAVVVQEIELLTEPRLPAKP